MARLMSVAMTTTAVIERRKTVTRRKGWTFLKPGDRLALCQKVMGRKPGEPLVRLAEVEVVGVRREPLSWLRSPGAALWWAETEIAAEGFPGMDPRDFVQRFFIDAQGMSPDDEVTRIEWRYLPDTVPTPGRTWTDPMKVDGGGLRETMRDALLQDVELRGIVRQDGEGRVFKVRADEVEILSEPAARWADLFGAAPNYTGGVPVDEWLEAHRGEA